MKRRVQQAYFGTLAEALAAEELLDLWAHNFPCGEININYGETFRRTVDHPLLDRYVLVSVYRDTNGRYERPIHYLT